MSGVSFSEPQSDNKDMFANLFADNALVPIKPKADASCLTYFRPIPEIDQNGQPRPMVIGHDAFGPRFSAVRMENVAVLAGVPGLTRWTGFTTCHDMPGLNDFDNPWSGTFIRLKSKVKKNELPDHLYKEVNQLLTKGDKSAPMEKPKEMMLVQGVCFQLNSKPSQPPVTRACLLLTATGAKALQKLMLDAANKGEDLFHPQTGVVLLVSGKPADGGQATPVFTVERGQVTPLPPEVLQTWVPWEKAIRYRTYDEHIAQMARCYRPEILALNAPVGQALARLGISTAPGAVNAPVAAPAAAPAPVAVAQAPAAPAAAPAMPPSFSFGPAPVAPAPVAAPVAPVPVMPSPVPTPPGAVLPAPASPTPPVPANDLAASFQKMIQDMNKPK